MLVRLCKSPDTIRSLTVAIIGAVRSVSAHRRYVILLTARTRYLNLLTWYSDRDARINEALCKVLYHNIRVVIQLVYELGVKQKVLYKVT